MLREREREGARLFEMKNPRTTETIITPVIP